uniref:Chordin n=1 Tax=Halocynthia roretzi TaxID=7729 RepID=Q964I1_HALRO|nr:chordin [Halocynthia roretzi]
MGSRRLAKLQFLGILCTCLLSLTEGFFPLKSENLKMIKPAKGCMFGNRYHTAGSSWHPNLGFPFGVMYCIRCNCVKYAVAGRSKKELTKVVCHDVRKDCPPVSCKGAKVQRGECCKTCPEESVAEKSFPSSSKWDQLDFDSKFLLEKTLNDDEDRVEKSASSKQFVALLTNEEREQKSYLARATLTLQRGNLHFSIHHPNSSKPELVELVDESNSILYSHQIRSFKLRESLACGVWRNLPKNIIHALNEGHLILRLTIRNSRDNPSSDKALYASGIIITHRALYSETFSSQLYPDQDGGSGAIVMMTFGRNFKNINFAVIHRYVWPQDNRRRRNDQSIHISLELKNENGDTLRRTEKKVSQLQNEFADVWNTNSDMLRSLGKGSLHLVMEAQQGRRGDKQRFVGNITVKATCNLLQAVLSGSNCKPTTNTGSVGSAVFNVNSDNTISYQVFLSGLSSEVTLLQMTAAYTKKRSRVILDLTPQFHNGVSEGLLKEVSAKELHSLLSDKVAVMAQTKANKQCEINGNVASLLYSGHLTRYHGIPIPLSGSLVVPPVNTGAGGHAWLQLDDNCHLHYEIVVAGLSKDSDASVSAHLHGLAEIAGYEPTHKKLLKGFYGTEARGILKEINKELYEIMNNGSAFVQVATKRNPNGEIRGRVHIPNTCMKVDDYSEKKLDDYDKNATPVSASMEHDAIVHDSAGPQEIQSLQDSLQEEAESCYFEGVWHNHDKEWSPVYDTKCTSCICEHGNVLCNPVNCPSLSCLYPVVIESECCPVCQDEFSTVLGDVEKKEESYSIGSIIPLENQKTLGYEETELVNSGGCFENGENIPRPYGSSWHPVIHPFGQITCVVCTCHYNGEIKCEKVQCPATPCQNPVRENPGDCCKVCPHNRFENKDRITTDERWMQDGASQAMCTFGKRLHVVGASWNPYVHNFGKLKCITCTCIQDEVKGVFRKCVRNCPNIPKDCDRVSRSVHECCAKCIKRKLVT